MRVLFEAMRLRRVSSCRQIVLLGVAVLLVAVQVQAQTTKANQPASMTDAQKCVAVLSTVKIGGIRLGMTKAELEKAFPVAWKKTDYTVDSTHQPATDSDLYKYTLPAGSRLKSAAGIRLLVVSVNQGHVLGIRIQLAKWSEAASDEEFTGMLAAEHGIPQNLWQNSPYTLSKQITCGLYDFYISNNHGRELEASKAFVSSSGSNSIGAETVFSGANDNLSDSHGELGSGGGVGSGSKSESKSGSTTAGEKDGLPSAKSDFGTETCQSGQLDASLRIVLKPLPAVTQHELQAINVQGIVRLRVVFGYDGNINSIVVVRGLPKGLTDKAVEAAKLIKFVPAQKCGVPVTITRVIEYSFTIY